MKLIPQTHGESVNEGHLGGWSLGGDGGTYYPLMWEYMVKKYNVGSMIDVGCGRGYSAQFFKDLGCSVLGIDGSTIAQGCTFLDESEFFLHDFTKGHINTSGGFDLAWCCEFVEHVEPQYIENFMSAFQACKYVAMTFAYPGQGGHHHVNENDQNYWIEQMKKYNFAFLPDDTNELRQYALKDKEERLKTPNCPYFISHFSERGLFFENLSYEK